MALDRTHTELRLKTGVLEMSFDIFDDSGLEKRSVGS